MILPGRKLGPYEIVLPLGFGGMGEVYRARDPRLGREVAVKVVRSTGPPDPRRLDRFEREARAVAALSHPNVLTVHDVGRENGHPYVVFELLEGETLRERLERGPLPARRALEVAVEVCRGLEAAHARDLVHRDLKPDNVFLTSDGRVKILDFGLAKLRKREGVGELATSSESPGASDQTETAEGVILGTLGYLSPEQARGLKADARSDLFALGAVLYEMLMGRRAFSGRTPADTLLAILQQDPAPLRSQSGPAPGAVEQLVKRCLAKEPDERFHSAHDLGLALEAVLERPGAGGLTELDFEEREPYPGLASFEVADSRRFFGREGEVEALWRRLKGRRLLAVIGPSGAGKTSFVRAGLVASRPAAWGAVVSTPGTAPLLMMGQALAPQLGADVEALRRLVRFEDPEVAYEVLVRWAGAHDRALVVVDQFEELFTLNSPEVQERFASLLGRLSEEGGVHVLVALRDDFLMRCQAHRPLGPLFLELTPLGPLSRPALRRALEEPAHTEGFAFEEGLVDTMLGEVEGERAALPLLAFAVSRLWEARDEERRLLTHEAYREIGGVSGALAQHAEATLERIGPGRRPVVREIFRNLVTSQGTRTVVEREELLSVFPERETAEDVLDCLVAARLLSSFESPTGEGTGASAEVRGSPRIEIVHESLLSSWLRLVRWQTQDAAGALLRDQLRQASRIWGERGRPEDLLWTGASYLEYRAWRARYPGRLSSLEEAFAEAMTRLATRRRRQRVIAVVVLVVLLALGLGTVSVFWARSEASRSRAELAARRAEASRLLTLGRAELARNATGAVAYAMKSLELADTEMGRFLALAALQRAPVARVVRQPGSLLEGSTAYTVDFCPSGGRIATGGDHALRILNADGRWSQALGEFRSAGFERVEVVFSPRGDAIAAGKRGRVGVWSLPVGRELLREELREASYRLARWGNGFLSLMVQGPDGLLRWWPFGLGESRALGRLGFVASATVGGSLLAYSRGPDVFIRSVDDPDSQPRRLVHHSRGIWGPGGIALSSDGRHLAAADVGGEIRVWPTGGETRVAERVIAAPGTFGVRFGPAGRWLSARGNVDGCPTVRLVDLAAPPGAEPLVLQRGGGAGPHDVAFSPDGDWLVSTHESELSLWWLGTPRPHVMKGHLSNGTSLAFTPDGRWLVSVAGGESMVRMWPLVPSPGAHPHVIFDAPLTMPGVTVDPQGRHALLGGARGQVFLIPLDGSPVRRLEGFSEEVDISAVAFNARGDLAAAAPRSGPADEKVIRVWNLEAGDVQVLGPVPGAGKSFVGTVPEGGLNFVGEDRVVAFCVGIGLVSFDLQGGESEILLSANSYIHLSHGGTFGVRTPPGSGSELADDDRGGLLRFEVGSGATTPLEGYPRRIASVAFDRSDRLIAVGSGTEDGVIRVGSVDGGEPHLLFGHVGWVSGLAFSPDGRWLASTGADKTVRLWPVPDVFRIPLHVRPVEELLRVLATHTNVRAVDDPASASGYRLEPGPFPGWDHPPEW